MKKIFVKGIDKIKIMYIIMIIVIIIERIKAMQKYSKQREMILKSLKNREDHPTAEKLYLDLKKEMPEIGIATIYRNLQILTEQNEILKINGGKESDRFDGNTKKHFHFVCEKCKNLYDVFLEDDKMEQWEKWLENIAKNTIADIQTTNITINGICKNCKKKEEETK